jgi:hypothetical protein
MLCPTCGNDLAQDARFCTRCGAQTGLPSQPGSPTQPFSGYGAPLPYSRVGNHIQTLGTLWLIYAAVRFMTKLAGLFFLHGMFGHHAHADWMFGSGPFSNAWMAALWPIALTSLIISVALCLLTGYALITRQPWGRVFGIIFGILALFHPFLGTALGIYTLWVLAPGASGVEYEAISRSTPQS